VKQAKLPEPTSSTTGEIDVDDILTEANAKVEAPPKVEAKPAPAPKRAPAKTEPMKAAPAPAPAPVPAAPPPPKDPAPARTSPRTPATQPRVVPPPTDPVKVAEAPADEVVDDGYVPGVPRRVSPQAKRIVGIAVLVAAVLAVVGGLQALRAKQEREIEAVNARVGGTAAKPSRGPESAPPPASTAAPEPPAAASAVPPEPSASAPAETASAAASASAAPPVESPGTTVSTPGVVHAPAASGAVALPPGPDLGHETPVDMGPAPPKDDVIAQATRALQKGDTAKAVTLARQAVASNPCNAYAWLTLGAAYQASGNGSAAHDAYKSCIAQAHSAGLTECRMLAGH
jgi:hypothetical protein